MKPGVGVLAFFHFANVGSVLLSVHDHTLSDLLEFFFVEHSAKDPYSIASFNSMRGEFQSSCQISIVSY
jgi:hypothetical protein